MPSRPTLFPAYLLPVLAAIAAPTAAPAQDNASGTSPAPILSLPRPSTQPAQPQRQGPELDVFRDTTPPQPVTPPPPVTTTTPPPATTPASPAASGRDRAPAATRRPETSRPASEAASAREASNILAPATPEDTAPSATEEAIPSVGNDAVAPATETAPPVPAEAPPAPARDTPWAWIAAALALVAVTALAFLLRRRPVREEDDPAQESAPPIAPSPARPPPPSPVPPRAAATPPAPAPSPTARPWVEIDLAVDSARHGDAGLSVGYRIALRNRGDAPANDIMVHALLGHADANQNDVLRAFFSGQAGQPVHSVVEIAAGATYVLEGELRLPPHLVEPVELDGRLLLVPLVAFDVHYRWSAGTSAGAGRSGSAFIVGREQTPPSPRLAPFRYDLGPRDHIGAKVGCRRTALSLAS